jgi:hypothetical protein
MRYSLLLPLLFLGLTGCVVAGPAPGPVYVAQPAPVVVERPVVQREVVVVHP